MAFVATEDGYLLDPCFMGTNWFVRCSEDEGLMLVIKCRAKTLKAVKGRMRRILRDNKIPAVLGSEGYTTTTAFPPNFSGLHTAWKWEIILNGMMPKLPVFPEQKMIERPQGEVYGYAD